MMRPSDQEFSSLSAGKCESSNKVIIESDNLGFEKLFKNIMIKVLFSGMHNNPEYVMIKYVKTV